VKLWIQIRQDPDPQGSSDLKTVASVVEARAPLSTYKRKPMGSEALNTYEKFHRKTPQWWVLRRLK
jgi:hypothetical protein